MIDYENLPDIAGLDGLMSIFPRDYPVSHSELFTLWQLHQQSTIPYTYHEPRWHNPMDEYRETPWFLPSRFCAIYPGIHHPSALICPI